MGVLACRREGGADLSADFCVFLLVRDVAEGGTQVAEFVAPPQLRALTPELLALVRWKFYLPPTHRHICECHPLLYYIHKSPGHPFICFEDWPVPLRCGKVCWLSCIPTQSETLNLFAIRIISTEYLEQRIASTSIYLGVYWWRHMQQMGVVCNDNRFKYL